MTPHQDGTFLNNSPLKLAGFWFPLDDATLDNRLFQVVKLKNAVAADVATYLNDFLTQSLTVYNTAAFLTGFRFIEKQVVIVPDPITNALLISATPQYFEKLMNIVAQVDQLPPQVMIQSLIAEVSYTDLNEFGVELGFQSPVLFQRSLVNGGVTL